MLRLSLSLSLSLCGSQKMAAAKQLLSHTRRHCHVAPRPLPSLSHHLLLLSRTFSSDDSRRTRPHPVPIQPVSYVVKPKDPTEPDPERDEDVERPMNRERESYGGANETRTRERVWTREDIRYMKDMPSSPSISPVSYFPSRVAPLPDDIATQELEMERRRIKEESRGRNVFRAMDEAAVKEKEEQSKIPFPRLIKPNNKKKEERPIFDLVEAVRQVKANARKTFNESLEAHVRLGIDKARSDLIVRGTLTLPHGGKKVLRIAVFAEGSDAEEARAAGADIVGGVELIDEIASAGKVDFDKCYTTPKLYPRVAKIARILNRQGLMPDSKQGTVVKDVSKAVKEAKKNQIKFRMDKSSIVHVGLGKVSFTEEALRENVGAFMNAILQAKPAGLKKTSKYAGYITSFHICSTMGAGFPISLQSLSKAADHYIKVHLQ